MDKKFIEELLKEDYLGESELIQNGEVLKDVRALVWKDLKSWASKQRNLKVTEVKDSLSITVGSKEPLSVIFHENVLKLYRGKRLITEAAVYGVGLNEGKIDSLSLDLAGIKVNILKNLLGNAPLAPR